MYLTLGFAFTGFVLCDLAVFIYPCGQTFISGTWTLLNVACNHRHVQASTPGLILFVAHTFLKKENLFNRFCVIVSYSLSVFYLII